MTSNKSVSEPLLLIRTKGLSWQQAPLSAVMQHCEPEAMTHVPVQGIPRLALSFLPTVTAVGFKVLGAPGCQTEKHLSKLRPHPCVVPAARMQDGEPVTG